MLRALRSSKPHSLRAAGRRFNVGSALIWPAFAIVLTGPRMPSGSSTQRAVVGLDAREIELHELGGRELAREDRRMDVGDARLDEMELAASRDRGRGGGGSGLLAAHEQCCGYRAGGDELEPVQR